MRSETSPLKASSSGPAAPASASPVSASGTSQEMEDFIYLISHDVRASVRALIELPQWITEDLQEAGVQINENVASSIELMNRHTGRLDRMLVDLLAFSRVGRMQEVEEVLLDTALDEVLEELKVPSDFTIECALQHPSVTLGTKDLLTVLRALISNGIKHHDREDGTIEIASRREGPWVLLTVRDDGPGIEEPYRERVFAPMTTLRPRDEVEGSGMGLPITKKVAQYYGGSARMYTPESGQGIEIEVRLPVSQPH